jgi:hypothetical protein
MCKLAGCSVNDLNEPSRTTICNGPAFCDRCRRRDVQPAGEQGMAAASMPEVIRFILGDHLPGSVAYCLAGGIDRTLPPANRDGSVPGGHCSRHRRTDRPARRR